LAWLIGIAITAAAMAWACRQRWLPKRATRLVLAVALAAGELMRLPSSGLHFPGRLPLELCNVSTWAAVLACLTLTPLAVEFVYFAGLTGAAMALLNPDLGSSWPPQFFLNHGGIVVTASALVFGRLAPLRNGSVWRAFGLLSTYAAAIGIFNWVFRTNYAYLCTKPRGMTLFRLMGPWPVYILSAAVLALALFWLLWLPVRKRAIPAGSRLSESPERGAASRGGEPAFQPASPRRTKEAGLEPGSPARQSAPPQSSL
jgi:hypothetical integral membrane protein (TIGR02206 family)